MSTDTELAKLINGETELVVAGERMDVGLLQRFYARHGFEPVWSSRPEQAKSLVDAVLQADDHGLDPDRFYANLLRHRSRLPPLQRDLVMSEAFLSYADALARGAVPVERRGENETLTPGTVDVPAVLDAAIDSPHPGAEIEALAPKTATYRVLRQALRQYRSGSANGAPSRLRTIEVNLERQRWLPRPLPADRVRVNAADQGLVLYLSDQPAIAMRVVVGQDGETLQTPEFRAMIEAVLFNPPWRIPDDIAEREIMPILGRDPNYLKRNNIVTLPDGGLEQRAGPDAGLGLLMFNMPNRFDVYLHDTPDKYLFNRDNRRVSHGCIRVQHPRDLAALLMGQSMDAINEEIATGATNQRFLPGPVPVIVVYQTAFVDTDGELQFRPDFYNRDARIWRQLHRRPNRAFEANDRPTPSGPSAGAGESDKVVPQALLKSAELTRRA
jgi:murein L,D-transpeptidase YcbB/YkuD